MEHRIEFDELKKLRDDLIKIRDEMDNFISDCAKELAARLLRKVIKRTPVGHKPNIGESIAKVTGVKGKKRSFLTREGAILDKYWNDYRGGTLRRGWTAKSEEEAKTSGANPSIGAFVDSIKVSKKGENFEIIVMNPVHYASYVEFGHFQQKGRYVPALGKRLKNSWVKGRFMLTISEDEIRKITPALLEKKLKIHLENILR